MLIHTKVMSNFSLSIRSILGCTSFALLDFQSSTEIMLSKLIGKRFLFLISIYCFPHLICYGGRPTTPRDCGDDEAFQCGSIMYIAAPFWGGNRPEICGRSGFELVCQGNVPMINISSMSYRVIEINLETNTLTVAREDLWNTTCPTSLRNTTIDPDLFQYSDGQDKNVSLFYGCTSADGQGNSNSLPNKFNCDTNKLGTFNVYATGDVASSPGPNITCADSIYVPVNKDKAKSLKTRTRSSINILQPALAAGFSIQWVENSLDRTRPFCNANVYSSCISMTTRSSRRPCTYANSCINRGTLSPSPAPAPEPNSTKDSSPVPSPAPEGDHHSQRGKGFHPVQTGGFSPGPGRFNISTTRKGHLRSSKEIIIGLVAGITAIALGSIIIYWRLGRQRSRIPLKQNHYPMLEKCFLEQGSLAPKRYKYYELKQITRFFTDKLGQGGFGSVYKGALPDGCPVAVKVLTETHSDGEEFINEVVSISRTSHINIINLVGFCYEKNKRALIYEYMPNKSLDKFIGDSESSNEACCLDLETLYSIARGVAKGLEYLHNGCNTRIVHFDIKPQNILLDEDFCPKISDFGLAKLCKKKQSVLSMLGARGTIGYIAPEIFSRNFGRVSHKSDVYSYGMMVLDMVGGKENTVVAVAQSSENYFPDKIYEQLLLDLATTEDECVMVEEQEERRRKLFLVGFWCIQTIPANRPPISKVIEMLEGSLESIKIPPKPLLFHPMLADQELSPSLSMYEETHNSDSAEIAVVN